MRKIISITLAFLLCFVGLSLLPEFALPAKATEIDFSYGETCTWYYDTNTGVFSVTGTGSTYDFKTSLDVPFRQFTSVLPTVKIGEGIKRLGTYALGLCVVYDIYLPSTLETIDCYFSSSVNNIYLPGDNSLKYVNTDSIKGTNWFKSQPEGPVYLGDVLIGYNGEITDETKLDIKDGTTAVAEKACNGDFALADISFPQSIVFIGKNAFYGTAWLDTQPIGPLYIGNVLYCYKGNPVLEDYDFFIREGTVSVCYEAFRGRGVIQTVHFPQSLEYIGERAFYMSSSLKNLDFPENSNLKYIGNYAFEHCRIGEVTLPEGMMFLGDLAFGPMAYMSKLNIPSTLVHIGNLYSTGSGNVDICSFFNVSTDNAVYSSDENGNLYNKNKTVFIRASTGNSGEFTMPDSVTEIAPGAFRNYGSLFKKIVLNDGIERIGAEAFALNAYDSVGKISVDFGLSEPETTADIFYRNTYMPSVTVRSMTYTLPERTFSSVTNEDFTVYLMRGSAMQTYCEENGINFEFLDYALTFSEINNALSNASELDRSLYTAESLAMLDGAVSAVNLQLNDLTQAQVDEWTQAINAALSYLEYLPADFTLISEALARATAVNRLLYTADSLLALDSLVLSVDYKSNITQQAAVNSLAAGINSAVDALIYRDADYSAVNSAISRALAVNRNYYTEQSLANLDSALRSVEYGLDITFQSKVNAFASGIDIAISALVAKAADYTDVEQAVRRAESLNREYYTAESLAAVDAAILSVDYSLTYYNQQSVAQYAAVINSAIDSLKYLPADYSDVDEAINLAHNIDRLLWSKATIAMLDQSIDSVDRSLNITQQAVADAYAQTILNKINSLEYAAVTLRNETQGVIVGATAKEIYPLTALSVEKLDPSDITGANFAVGGKVKTALYYDISLIRNSVKVQPDGTVTVKIRIPDGVEPGKCKVYHVTDDPVDPLVKFISTLDGNYIVFKTDHFSEFAVLEIETVPECVAFTELPSKTIYNKGETFDPDGMVITAFYSNGTSEVIKNYDISVDTNTAGIKPLTVYYTFNGVTKTATTIITVKETGQSEIILKTPVNTTVEFRAKVTVVVRSENLSGAHKIVLYANGKKVAEANDEIRYYNGEIKAPVIYKATVVDNSGKMIVSEFTVSVNNSFLARITAFFKGMFRILPKITIEP